MSTEIRMPEIAPDGSGVTLARWLVAPGDTVHAGDVIAEAESDKAVVEIEAEAGGVVSDITVPEGTAGVAPHRVIAVLDGSGAAAAAGEADGGPGGDRPTGTATAVSPAAAQPREAAGGAGAAGPSRLAARMAAQAGIRLDGIAGAGGRIGAADVLAAVGRSLSPRDAPRPATAPPVSADRPVADGFIAGGPVPDFDLDAPDAVRRTVAGRLAAAKREQPHYYMTATCTVDPLLELRRVLSAGAPEAERVSVNDLLIKITATALANEPALNAAWSEAGIRRFRRVDLAVAVASERGLITPVLRDAARLGVAEIGARMRALAERADRGDLAPEEYRGGTFTLSNLGMFGVSSFSAIINPPQAAILAVGAAEPVPVVDGDTFATATRMSFTLSVDHRVGDGVEGARFLAEMRRLVEDPRRLLL